MKRIKDKPRVNFFVKKTLYSDVRQSKTKKILSSIAAIFCALVIAIIIANSVCGTWKKCGDVIRTLFTAGYQKSFINSLFSNMSIMIVAGLAFIFAYKAGLFNIGISGQMVFGGTMATLICHKCGLGAGANQVVILIVSMLSAAAIAGIVGALKAFLNVNEVVSSIMFNWIIYFLSVLLLANTNLPKDSSGLNTAAPSNDVLFRMGANSYVPLLIMAGLLVVIISVIINFTVFGKKQKVTGLSRTGALASGYNVKANMIASMAISGAISGVLGVMLYCGFSPQMPITAAAKAIPQEGFNGISVGLIAMCSPVASVPVSLFFSMVQTSVSDLQMIGVDNHIAQVIFGIVVYGSAAIALFLNLKPYWLTLKIGKGKRYSQIKHESNIANIALIEYASDYNAQLKKYYYYNKKQQRIKSSLALSPGQKFKKFMANIRYKLVQLRVRLIVKINQRKDSYSNNKYYRQEMIHIVKKNGKLVIDSKHKGRCGLWIKPTEELLISPKLVEIIAQKSEIQPTTEFIEEVKKAGNELIAKPFDSKELRKIPLLAYLQNLRTGLAYRYDIANQNTLDKESLENVDRLEKSLGLPSIKTKEAYKIAYAAHLRAYNTVSGQIDKFYKEAYAKFSPNKKACKNIQFDISAVKYDLSALEKTYLECLRAEVRKIRDDIDKPMFLLDEVQNTAALSAKKGA